MFVYYKIKAAIKLCKKEKWMSVWVKNLDYLCRINTIFGSLLGCKEVNRDGGNARKLKYLPWREHTKNGKIYYEFQFQTCFIQNVNSMTPCLKLDLMHCDTTGKCYTSTATRITCVTVDIYA